MTQAETIAFSSSIETSASCEQVYAALDLTSQSNRYITRGMALSPIPNKPGLFNMINPQIPDIVFTMTEVEANAPSHYHIRTDFPGGQPIGILTGEETSYRLKPSQTNGCVITATGLFATVPLTKAILEQEIALLEIAVHDDLVRLAALLEQGADAANHAGILDDVI